MTPRDTRTGSVLEQMVIPALSKGGYTYQTQVVIGKRPGGGKHKIDALAERNEAKVLISLKWQQVSGTAEQKVPYEAICLAHAIRQGGYNKAYLVLGGAGWSLREFYVKGGLAEYYKLPAEVRIVKLEDFIALANQGRL